jgi:prevent-host-death family protein
MGVSRTFSASEFKARCLHILDRIYHRGWESVVVTKHGVPVAALIPPTVEVTEVEQLHGLLRGSVVIPPEIDLTSPVSEEAFAADQGESSR